MCPAVCALKIISFDKLSFHQQQTDRFFPSGSQLAFSVCLLRLRLSKTSRTSRPHYEKYTSIICKNLPVCLTSFDFFWFSIIPVCLVSFNFFWFSIIALSLFTSCSFFESLCWAVLATIFNESMVDCSCFVMPSGSEWFRWDSWTFWKSSFNCP